MKTYLFHYEEIFLLFIKNLKALKINIYILILVIEKNIIVI